MDLITIIQAAGYLGIFLILFAESGVLIGFFLPGDSLLFTAGFLASQGYLHITTLASIAFVAAVSGDSVGYYLGHKFGYKFFNKQNSFFFDREHIGRSERFFGKYGAKAIVMARFLPVVRTVAPILAGVGNMRYGTFLIYNVAGGALWGVGLPLAGYFLGRQIPDIDRYLLPLVGLIVFISLLPTLIHVLKDAGHRRKLAAFLFRK